MNGQIVAVDILNNRRADSDCWLKQAVAYIQTDGGETATSITPAQYDALRATVKEVYDGRDYSDYVELRPIEWDDVFPPRGM